MRNGPFIWLIKWVARIILFFWHPVFRIKGRENIVKGSRLMICANHSGAADPVWIVFALGYVPRIMAKKEVMQVPVLGWVLKKVGVFGVDRDGADITAIKTGLRCLNDEQQLLIFPEGTRVKEGQTVAPKRGAMTLAARTQTPVLPVYISPRKHPFCPVTCVIGKSYVPQFESKKPTDEELAVETDKLMEMIYGLGNKNADHNS